MHNPFCVSFSVTIAVNSGMIKTRNVQVSKESFLFKNQNKFIAKFKYRFVWEWKDVNKRQINALVKFLPNECLSKIMIRWNKRFVFDEFIETTELCWFTGITTTSCLKSAKINCFLTRTRYISTSSRAQMIWFRLFMQKSYL